MRVPQSPHSLKKKMSTGEEDSGLHFGKPPKPMTSENIGIRLSPDKDDESCNNKDFLAAMDGSSKATPVGHHRSRERTRE